MKELSGLFLSFFIPFLMMAMPFFAWRVFWSVRKMNDGKRGIVCAVVGVLLGAGMFGTGIGICQMAPKVMPDLETVNRISDHALAVKYMEYIERQPPANSIIPAPWQWTLMFDGLVVAILSVVWMAESYDANKAYKAQQSPIVQPGSGST